jgi:DNA-directed RNA polymerase specialized sigma subunit
MTSKEYLSQARFLDASIRTKVEQIESLNDLATSCTAVISDMPRNPNRGGSRMADAVLQIIDLQEEIKRDMMALVQLKREIMDAIKSVSSLEYQTILEKRYLCFISWERIAVELGYSIQHTYRLHDAALKEIDSILNVES